MRRRRLRRPDLRTGSRARRYNLRLHLRVVGGVIDDGQIAGAMTSVGAPATGWGRTVTDDDALAALYLRHFPSLVRLAALLLDDLAASEDVAQEAYVRVALARRRLRDPDAGLAYLRRTVVNLARSALRRRLVARRHGYLQSRPDAIA